LQGPTVHEIKFLACLLPVPSKYSYLFETSLTELVIGFLTEGGLPMTNENQFTHDKAPLN